MWQNYFQWFLMLALLIGLLVVGFQNMEVLEQQLRFTVFQYQVTTKVLWALLSALGGGMGLMFILTLVQNIGLRMNLRSVRKENDSIRRELTKLRNLNVEDDLTGDAASSSH